MNLKDFPLENNDKIIIQNWLNTFDKPLFISGKIGIGKTSLYETILKDYTIVIIEHKLIKNLKVYIEKTVNEKDISMMFNNKRKYKAIIFDNISYTDRNLIQYLIQYKKNINKVPIVIICNDFNNKQIKSISSNCNHIYLKYTYEQFYEKCKKMYPNIKDELIRDSNYNFHMIQSNLNFYDTNYNTSNSYIDSYIQDINILNDNFKKKINTKKLFRIYSCDYNTISLNILDDIIKSKSNNINDICKIYENMINYDNYENKRIKYNILANDISILYGIYLPYTIIHTKKMKLSKNIVYNSYTSKSLIYTHLNNMNNTNFDIYFYILKCLISKKYENIKKHNIYNKQLNIYIKLYEYIYNITICKKSIKKLYDIK